MRISNCSCWQDPDHVFDFRGLRLDWARLQSYLSSGKGSVLEKQRELAALLNTVRWETIIVFVEGGSPTHTSLFLPTSFCM
jgi:hypothetical protein